MGSSLDKMRRSQCGSSLSLPNPQAICIPFLLQYWLHVQECAAVDARGDPVVVPPGPVLGAEMLFLWRLRRTLAG